MLRAHYKIPFLFANYEFMREIGDVRKMTVF